MPIETAALMPTTRIATGIPPRAGSVNGPRDAGCACSVAPKALASPADVAREMDAANAATCKL